MASRWVSLDRREGDRKCQIKVALGKRCLVFSKYALQSSKDIQKRLSVLLSNSDHRNAYAPKSVHASYAPTNFEIEICWFRRESDIFQQSQDGSIMTTLKSITAILTVLTELSLIWG